MFTSSVPFEFGEYMRIPVTVDRTLSRNLPKHVGALHASSSPLEPRLLWTRSEDGRHARGTRTGHHKLADIDLVCPVFTGTPEEIGCRRWTGGEGWRPLTPVQDLEGSAVAQVWINDQGSVFLPFDPGEAMSWLWSERYTTLDGVRLRNRLRQLLVTQLLHGPAVAAPEAAAPAPPRPRSATDVPGLPRLARGARACTTSTTGCWTCSQQIAGEPVPYLHPWPNGHTSAFVLTHDVETAAGRDAIETLRAPERARGLRSVWNLVPERYPVPDELLDGAAVRGLRDRRARAAPRRPRPGVEAHAAQADFRRSGPGRTGGARSASGRPPRSDRGT